MTRRPQATDPRTRLALGCSALARAGQALSTTTSPGQARKVLTDVAVQLESDGNLSQLIPVGEIAQQCREASALSDEAALVAACRRMATGLARRASSLAAEVQQQAVGSPGAAPSRAVAPAPAEEITADPVLPIPSLEATTTPEPTPVPEAPAYAGRAPIAQKSVPVAPRSGVNASRLARLTIASSAAELEAVGLALEAGRRFARVQGVVIIDINSNLMWQAQLQPTMSHAVAMEAVRGLETGGYRDWRLPSSREVEDLLGQNGLQALRGLGVLPAMSAPLLRTSEVRSRFLGLMKDVLVFNSGTGESLRRSLGDVSVQVLAVRGG